jgi:hypothetical protein
MDPESSKESGKPAAIAKRRQNVPAITLPNTPAAVASATASKSGNRGANTSRNKAHVTVHAISADNGQRIKK